VLRINRRHHSCDHPWPPNRCADSEFFITSQHFDDSLRKQHQLDDNKNIFDHNQQRTKLNKENEIFCETNKTECIIAAKTIKNSNNRTISSSTTTENVKTNNKNNNNNSKKQTNHLSTESYMCNKVGRQTIEIQQNLWSQLIEQEQNPQFQKRSMWKKTFYLPNELLHGGELDRKIHRYFKGIALDDISSTQCFDFKKSLNRSQSHEVLSNSMNNEVSKQQQQKFINDFPIDVIATMSDCNRKNRSQSYNELPPVKPKKKNSLA
jgi:hypothetical protein